MVIITESNASNLINEEDEEEPGEVIESAPPLKVGEERTLGSSGIKKKLLKCGSGFQLPDFGDEVTIKFVGCLLDGTRFAESDDRNYKVGSGEMVSGLDRGIVTMKKGEKALFTLPPELAYGEAGRDGVPPNSYIKFQVELISWITVIDVSKDGGVIKRVVVKGEQTGKPCDLDEVLVKYVVTLADGTLLARTPEEGVEFYVNDGHLCPALPKAIKTMNRGEMVNLEVQPKSKAALGAIFKKREDHAAKAVVVEVDRVSKRKRAGDGSPAVEKVPAFLTERPIPVDEDPNPFVVKWGLLNRDTIVGDSRAAAEWSRNVITPRDTAHVVESSEDLQIELLGAQALASANAYHQAALHNLKTVRAEKLIAERDRDRYFASSTQNFEMFRGVERELVDEKERIRQLEAQLQRGREEVIAEYKASQEFDDLLNAEYDANFPSTFKDCWESIIEELGTKIEGVSLDKFPVPVLSGASKDTIMDTADLTSQPIDDSEPFLDGDFTDAAKDDVPLNLGEEAPQDDTA